MKIIETQRLVLRNFIDDDLDELVDYRSNILCSKYQRGQDKDRENLALFIEKSKTENLLSFGKKHLAIANKITNTLVGDIFVAIKDPTITLGYTISYKHHRQGYATEVLEEIIAYLHKLYPDFEIVAMTDTDNLPSIKLLEKLHFSNEGYAKEIDSLIFSKFTKLHRL